MSKGGSAKRKAWRYFYPEGNGKAKSGYVLHHKDITIRHTDEERYYEWRIEDLEMMLKSEHSRLHTLGNQNLKDRHWTLSDDHKQKISESLKNKHGSWLIGHYVSEETKEKHREAMKGNHYTRGRKMSDDEKRKHSESMKAYWRKINDQKQEIDMGK